MSRVIATLLIAVLITCGCIGLGIYNIPDPHNNVVVTLQRPMTQVEMIEKSMQSVVRLSGTVSGTGFYIGSGIIVTAGHLAAEGVNSVQFEDGFECVILRQIKHPAYDCGFIIIEPVDRPALEFTLDEARRGQEIFILGHPHGYLFIATKGSVVGHTRKFKDLLGDIDMIICSTPAHPGNSGSPLLDSDGKVIGLWVGGRVSRCREFLVGLTAGVHSRDIMVALAEANLEVFDGSRIEN